MAERDLQKKCNDWLRKQGILFLHLERGRGSLMAHRGGVPDLLIWHHGKHLAVELKAVKGCLGHEQIEWIRQYDRAGFQCFVFKDFNMFRAFVADYLGIVNG